MNSNIKKEVAVLIPCYNEQATIRKVILSFKEILPEAQIYVYDNHSTDDTVKEASIEGVIIRNEDKRGKGYVVCKMFREIEADIYILVDGDTTYDITNASNLVEILSEKDLDMINVARISTNKNTYKLGRKLGNIIINNIVGFLLKTDMTDVLSGYKIFNRSFVKNFPCCTCGFEIEIEMILYCIKQKLKTAEYNTLYYPRPENSTTKLSFFKDGFGILLFLIKNFKK